MYVLAKDIVERNLIEGAKLVAGKKGVGRPMLWVNVMEILDALDSLQQGELLVTTGYQLDDAGRYRDLVLRLKSRGVCGIAIQTGYYIHTIPQYILDDANRYDLPVFEFPSKLTFSYIMHSLLGAISSQNENQASMDITLLKDRLKKTAAGMHAPAGVPEAKMFLFLLSPSSFNSAPSQSSLRKAARRLYDYLGAQSLGQSPMEPAENQIMFALWMKSETALQNALVDLVDLITLISREEHINVLLGVSSIPGPKQTDTAFEQVMYVSRMMRGVGAKKAVCHYKNARFFEWFENFYQKDNALSFAYDILKPVINYDYFHKSDYLKTLRLFLANDCKISETADRLFIHRHTLKNRLDKIEQLCSIDFSDFYTKLHFSIALIVYDFFLS